MTRIREWIHRYAVAEVCGLLCALVAATVAGRSGGAAAAAVAGTLGEAVGFYGVIIVREVRRHGPRWTVVRGLLVEFGVAELADTLLVRPLAIYGATVLAGDTVVGVLVGKVAADVIFYAVAITGYELHKRWTAAPARPAVTVVYRPAPTPVHEWPPFAPTLADQIYGRPEGRVYGRRTFAAQVYGRPATDLTAAGRPD